MNAINKARRGGFTLVELLIVIIIIAILAGMMMLTTGAVTERAEATKIINDLRSIKAAAILYYADHHEWPGIGGDGSESAALVRYNKSISKYMDRSLDKRYKGVWIQSGSAGGGLYPNRLYIGVRVRTQNQDSEDEFSKGVLKKLTEARHDAGLYAMDGNTVKPFDGTKNWHVYMTLK